MQSVRAAQELEEVFKLAPLVVFPELATASAVATTQRSEKNEAAPSGPGIIRADRWQNGKVSYGEQRQANANAPVLSLVNNAVATAWSERESAY